MYRLVLLPPFTDNKYDNNTNLILKIKKYFVSKHHQGRS